MPLHACPYAASGTDGYSYNAAGPALEMRHSPRRLVSCP